MPSSSQPTDTNNNSSSSSESKLTNGHAPEVLVVPIMSGATTVAGPIGAAPTSNHRANSVHNHESERGDSGGGGGGPTQTSPLAATAGAPSTNSSTPTNNDLISSIKQHEQQHQHQLQNNNNNVNHHNQNETNNNNHRQQTTRIMPPVRQQRQQHQQQQQNNSNSNSNSNSNMNSNRNSNSNSNSNSSSNLNSNSNSKGILVQQTRASSSSSPRNVDELTRLIRDFNFDRTLLSNEELIKLVKSNHISIYKLENFLGKDNASRCVEIRRDFYRLELAELDKRDSLGIRDRAQALLNEAKFNELDYERVNGACCENVIGHVKVPVGLAGPLILDGEPIFVPLATTEGCLVASTCRGLSALRKSGGVTSRIRRDFMTRAPIVRFNDVRLREALDNVERAIRWLNDRCNKEKMRAAFNLTSSHGRFIDYTMYPVNREIHIRFEAQTGDAMGMNMCSKGVESALKEMQRAFPTMEIVTLSGNMCTDKKAAGINWINGRGKAVECNAELPEQVVKQVFKVTVDQLVDRWKSKVMIGSALAASIGGFNSQAANILTAIFIATGQDPAQNVTSSNCMLILEKDSKGSLVVCCTMPSIECGTVGGGTILGDQSRYLQMMGVRGATPKQVNNLTRRNEEAEAIRLKHLNFNGNDPAAAGGSRILSSSQAYAPASIETTSGCAASGAQLEMATSQQQQLSPHLIDTNAYTNARRLARIICATVMAGELSLLAALTEGTLVKSHMRHNRSSNNVLGGGAATGGTGQPQEQAANKLLAGAGQQEQQQQNSSSCFGPLGSINNTTVITTTTSSVCGTHSCSSGCNTTPQQQQQQQQQLNSIKNHINNSELSSSSGHSPSSLEASGFSASAAPGASSLDRLC